MLPSSATPTPGQNEMTPETEKKLSKWQVVQIVRTPENLFPSAQNTEFESQKKLKKEMDAENIFKLFNEREREALESIKGKKMIFDCSFITIITYLFIYECMHLFI